MTRIAILLAMLGVCSAAREARACSCAAVNLSRALEASELVLEADVVELIERPDSQLRATLRVTRVFKGHAAAQIVYEGRNGDLCGMSFVGGEHYVVFGRIEAGRLQTSYCEGTAAGPTGRRAITWLEERTTPKPPDTDAKPRADATPTTPEPPRADATPTPTEPGHASPSASTPSPAPRDAAPDEGGEASKRRGCATSRDSGAPLAPLVAIPWGLSRRRRRR